MTGGKGPAGAELRDKVVGERRRRATQAGVEATCGMREAPLRAFLRPGGGDGGGGDELDAGDGRRPAPGDHPVLRLHVGGDGDRLPRVRRDEWLATFDDRRLDLIDQRRRDGRGTSPAERPEREDG